MYKPTLWYYQQLLFLVDHIQPRKSKAVGMGEDADNSQSDTVSGVNQKFYGWTILPFTMCFLLMISGNS